MDRNPGSGVDPSFGRLERTVDALRDEVRKAHEVAVEARASLVEHQKSCVHETRRTQEKVDEANRGVADVKERLGEIREDIRERRAGDDAIRRERQQQHDAAGAALATQLGDLKKNNQRIFIAIVIVSISIVGAVIGTALKPLVGQALDAAQGARAR